MTSVRINMMTGECTWKKTETKQTVSDFTIIPSNTFFMTISKKKAIAYSCLGLVCITGIALMKPITLPILSVIHTLPYQPPTTPLFHLITNATAL